MQSGSAQCGQQVRTSTIRIVSAGCFLVLENGLRFCYGGGNSYGVFDPELRDIYPTLHQYLLSG